MCALQPIGREVLAPVGMALVDNDVAQLRQDATELAVHRQHAAVEHVGVGDEQLRAVPRFPANALTRSRCRISTNLPAAAEANTCAYDMAWSGQR